MKYSEASYVRDSAPHFQFWYVVWSTQPCVHTTVSMLDSNTMFGTSSHHAFSLICSCLR